MIGDHKQLRPKAECYQLRKASNKGFDLDISLFERLAAVDKTIQHQVLQCQHRMCPEISAIIRKVTYPTLEDADTVKTRLPLRGIQGRGFFISHNELEAGEDDEALPTHSHVNEFEIDMVIATLKYLMQQGYKAADFGNDIIYCDSFLKYNFGIVIVHSSCNLFYELLPQHNMEEL